MSEAAKVLGTTPDCILAHIQEGILKANLEYVITGKNFVKFVKQRQKEAKEARRLNQNANFESVPATDKCYTT